jgi:hypothetical protein
MTGALASQQGKAIAMYEVTPLSEQLEKMVDRTSLSDILLLLAVICEEKTDHIRANWQDKTTANVWARCGRELDVIAARFKARGL